MKQQKGRPQPRHPEKTSWGFSKQTLLFLFIFLLPTQLGKHFFFPFSYVSGIRVDYLAPTLYLTDLLAVFLIVANYKLVIAFFKNKLVVFVLGLLLVHSVFFSISREISIYQYIKIIELMAVFAVFRSIRIDYRILFAAFLAGAAFQLTLAVLQMWQQHAIQGIFYFFGERAMSLGTPGIAKAGYRGVEILRPYGTFSHPNSLSGFYLLVWAFALSDKNMKALPVVKNILLVVCALLVLFSFSKVALAGLILVSVIIFFKKADFSCLPCIFSRIIVAVVVVLLFIPAQTDAQSALKRLELLSQSIRVIQEYPLGVGLGNYLVAKTPIGSLFFFAVPQPVHNIFLLLLAQTGAFFGGYILYQLGRWAWTQRKNLVFVLCLLTITLTGMFDHYWLTHQQNLLLMGVVLGASEQA